MCRFKRKSKRASVWVFSICDSRHARAAPVYFAKRRSSGRRSVVKEVRVQRPCSACPQGAVPTRSSPVSFAIRLSVGRYEQCDERVWCAYRADALSVNCECAECPMYPRKARGRRYRSSVARPTCRPYVPFTAGARNSQHSSRGSELSASSKQICERQP